MAGSTSGQNVDFLRATKQKKRAVRKFVAFEGKNLRRAPLPKAQSKVYAYAPEYTVAPYCLITLRKRRQKGKIAINPKSRYGKADETNDCLKSQMRGAPESANL